MSRVKRFATGVASGYAALLANIVYTLGSVPLALHYLTRAEFGLWTLVMQISSYLILLDLGMAGSISRILIDHKDSHADGAYGATIKTGAIVLVIQGGIIACVGFLLGLTLPTVLAIPELHARQFEILVAMQCVLVGIFFVFRICGQVLIAHQRYDVGNWTQIGYFAVNFAVMWIGFARGLGLYAMLAANAASMLLTNVVNFAVARQLRLFPTANAWGKANWTTFRHLFAFSSDLFLLSLGQQLVSSSQALIITRTLGLDVVAIWSVATKAFTLAQQFVWRLWDYSAGAIAEMIVRGERERLRRRFQEICIVTASLSILAAVGVAACNSSLLAVWTKGRIAWDLRNDVLCAVLLVINSVTRLHVGLLGPTKQIRGMRYIYFLEGLSFVALAITVAHRWGISGILVAAIAMNILWTGIFGVKRTAEEFNISIGEVVLGWLKVPAQYAISLVPISLLIWWWTRYLPSYLALITDAISIAFVGLLALWRFGLTPPLRQEALRILNKARYRFARRSE